ncbi:MAG TPA: helicase-related protein, partial [Steroidobacteraceae bacterium]|nr:helicase-related protein [Steroidobacteraceae bacterium]
MKAAVDVAQLSSDAPQCVMAADQPALERLATRLRARGAQGLPSGRERERFEALLAQSTARVEQRRSSIPALRYTEDLPVVRERATIEAAIRAHQVVLVCGDTGSGKSTQLPKLLLGLQRGCRGLIGQTQPRRIAARSIAHRIADELGVAIGTRVGYQVRFSERTDPSTLIKVMTDGILLAEIRSDPQLLRYDTLILDEAHERSLNIDFLLGFLRQLLPRRPDLKLIITSATLDPAPFSAYFGNAAVVTVAGRTYPIETRYRPPAADEEDGFDQGLPASVVAALAEILTEPSSGAGAGAAAPGEVTGQAGQAGQAGIAGIAGGDILVFLPGEREIRDCAEAVTAAYADRLEVLPLFSRLSWEQQQRVFERAHGQRVVLATNVAETSLTVPGIRSVIDSGL